MKESDLYLPVRDWLRARGCTVYVEIFDCDVLGIDKDGRMIAVELKKGVTSDLFSQLRDRATWADEVWGAVPASLRISKISGGLTYNGYGLLVVDPVTVSVKVRRKAKPQPQHWHKRRDYRRKVLMARKPARDCDLAGLPSCAQAKEQREISRRRVENAAIISE